MESIVLLYYKYTEIRDVDVVVNEQTELCKRLNLTGRIRIALEGINGTVSGQKSAVDEYIEQTAKRFEDVDWKTSPLENTSDAFDGSLIVKAVPCIVGNSTDVTYTSTETGTHLTPKEFHQKLQDEHADTVVIDVRNNYEYNIGHFDNALNPNTRKYDKFNDWVDQAKKEKLFDGKKNVLMYCTGGIRCEKASIELKKRLDHEHSRLGIYQLKGGIHRYLEEFDTNGLFKGKNFVFDKRVVQPLINIPEIVGKCIVCSTGFDAVQDTRRCGKCRVLLLVCDSCNSKYEKKNQKYYCPEHQFFDVNYYDTVAKRKELESQLSELTRKFQSKAYQGRRMRSKRISLQQSIADLTSLQILLNSSLGSI